MLARHWGTGMKKTCLKDHAPVDSQIVLKNQDKRVCDKCQHIAVY